jgi:hypothetical protein
VLKVRAVQPNVSCSYLYLRNLYNRSCPSEFFFSKSIAYSFIEGSVGIATDQTGEELGSIPGKGKRFFPSQFQTGSGAHSASYPASTEGGGGV